MPFLAGIWAKIAAVGALLLAAAAFIAKIYNEGRKAERGDNAVKGLEAERSRTQVDATVAAAGDPELERLRRKWSRE